MMQKNKNQPTIHPRHEWLSVAVLLGINTGIVDSITFMNDGGHFASLQTGNLIQGGLAVAQGHFPQLVTFLFPIIFFAIGGAANYIIKNYWQHKKIIWQQVSVFVQLIGILLVALIYNSVIPLISVSALAFFMALQADTFSKVRGIPFTSVMSTGNIKNLGQHFAALLLGKKTSAHSFGKLAVIIFGFFFGALLGGLGLVYFAHYALFLSPLTLLIILLILSFEKN